MIKKMTKYSFVLFHKEAAPFMEHLQNLGLVDVTRQEKAVDSQSRELYDKILRYDSVLLNLETLLKDKQLRKKEKSRSDVKDVKAEELLAVAQEKIKLRGDLQKSLSDAISELREAVKWGEFDKEDLKRLSALGYTLHFYQCNEKIYKKEWEEEFPLAILNKNASSLYFLVLENDGADYKFPLTESKFPERPASEVEKDIDRIEEEIGRNLSDLAALGEYIGELKKQRKDAESDFDLYMAKASAASEAEDTISVFEGFAPEENDREIEDFLKRENAYYIKEAAKEEDNPPVLLKNNAYSKLFEPIGELYMLPRYGEHDLTAYFAPFYMLFFGLCLGDIGYGLLLLVAGIIASYKLPEYKGYAKLVAWLGFGSIIMPLLSGTFFGGKLADIFGMSEKARALFFDDMQMFWFAIIFGLVQIVFARIMSAIFAISSKGILAGLHNIGWAILITWAAVWYASTQVPFSYPPFVNYIGLGGLVLILLFTSDNKNIFVKLFKGVAALYDITGVFGDMLSYIRLFGLGTTGGILGLVVNSIASQLGAVPYVGWLLMGIMLIFGHIFVLFISALGAFVHPMRLTFVEFYKNVGFDGGGRAYNPLKRNK